MDTSHDADAELESVGGTDAGAMSSVSIVVSSGAIIPVSKSISSRSEMQEDPGVSTGVSSFGDGNGGRGPPGAFWLLLSATGEPS